MIRHAYLHGFASSSRSAKGQAAARWYAERSTPVEFHTPDLNFPSFAELTYAGMLTAFDRYDTEHGGGADRWRLIGSSMGGWVAARWAALHPDRVDRLLLLCPAFDFVERWPTLLGEPLFTRWREQGFVTLPDARGVPTDVHYGLYADAEQQPARPIASCPTIILHGTRDDVVPIASSREVAAAHANIELIEVDDDHTLMGSLGVIEDLIDRFMLARTAWWEFFGPTAVGTAEHFVRHVDEFLVREGIDGAVTGVVVGEDGRVAGAWCRMRERDVGGVERALRPRWVGR